MLASSSNWDVFPRKVGGGTNVPDWIGDWGEMGVNFSAGPRPGRTSRPLARQHRKGGAARAFLCAQVNDRSCRGREVRSGSASTKLIVSTTRPPIDQGDLRHDLPQEFSFVAAIACSILNGQALTGN